MSLGDVMKSKKTSKTRMKRGAPVRVRAKPAPKPPARRPRVRNAPVASDSTPDGGIIVGVGASAGGLEAFSQVLEGLPENPGFPIIFVQHLSPTHDSVLPHLLTARAKLPVVQATDGMPVQTNHVYIIPPNAHMAIAKRRLHLTPRPADHTQYTPIDHFFHSLAEEAGSAAVGVVLSGTCSDGANGIREIKASGGVVLVQDPASAKYDGMPRSAMATGVVDRIVLPAQIAAVLTEIARHPRTERTPPPPEEDHPPIADPQFERVFMLLRNATGVDFSLYKQPTIKRRLQRRMVLQKLTSIEHYIRFLEETPGEVQQLHKDLLIHVTGFFREPGAFDALAKHVFPKLVESRREDQPIRIWVAGCSTGEEAYSVAIALLEFLGDAASSMAIQIFGTDVSEATIEHARAGAYPASTVEDVSAERLRRFFTKTDGMYRINKAVRDLCVFARQDLARDPPFSRVDLIVCRNVLIYLNSSLQKRLMGMFHYALRPAGFLMLAPAETIGTNTNLFAPVDKRHRIYRKKPLDLPATLHLITGGAPPPMRTRRAAPGPHEPGTSQNEANRIILQRYTPPAVVVDSDLQILEFRGQVGLFLEPAAGDASLNLLKMAREGLLHGLRAAIVQARKSDRPARKDGLRVQSDGQTRAVSVQVFPLGGPENRHYLVLFEEARREETRAEAVRPAARRARRDRKPEAVERLQEELAANREYLQSIIQDLEAANEELQSANEEVLSSNEELQSTNEELDTAKEELQSTNEELNTVNEELHARNEELTQVNSDLLNLLGSVQIAIVIVDSHLRIRRFTSMAEKTLNLIAGDMGRPITQIKPNIECPELEAMIRDVVENVVVRDCEVQDAQGKWYLLRIRPYKSVDNRIDGAVLTLFDISDSRRQQLELREALRLAEAVIDMSAAPLLILDSELRVHSINQALSALCRISPEQARGRALAELGSPWASERLTGLLQEVARTGERLNDTELGFEGARGAVRLSLRARPIAAAPDHRPLVLVELRTIGANNHPGSQEGPSAAG
jgi:two-component system, chemotaxis family, CheB/CheR fusion protein